MEQHVVAGNPPVKVLLRRSARARRLSLRISRIDGTAVLTLPLRVPLREATAFADAKGDWLRQHLARIGTVERPVFGGLVAFRGQDLRLTPGAVRSPRIEGDALILPADPDRLARRLLAFLRTSARDDLAAASDRHAAALGRGYRSLTLRDTRSRWGSCSSRGDLMYSWRLVMAPPEVLDYVAAHEVAHLERMDHSPAFWAVVARIFPHHARCRAWLRQNGEALHRLRFDAGTD